MRTVILPLAFGAFAACPAWSIQYDYDALNRLTRATYETGAQIDYSYDAAGNMTAMAITGIVTAPGVPTIQRVLAINQALRVFFVPPDLTGGSAITNYTVSCTPTGGGSTVTASGTTSPLTVTGLANHTTYQCSLHASNTAGSGSESALLAKTVAPASILPMITVILGN
jgi:YD repeat-containing protein